MTGFRSKALLAVAMAGVLFTTSPAFAFRWYCTASDSRHGQYTATAVGFNAVLVHNRASSRALLSCQTQSYYPQTCRIVSCNPAY